MKRLAGRVPLNAGWLAETESYTNANRSHSCNRQLVCADVAALSQTIRPTALRIVSVAPDRLPQQRSDARIGLSDRTVIDRAKRLPLARHWLSEDLACAQLRTAVWNAE